MHVHRQSSQETRRCLQKQGQRETAPQGRPEAARLRTSRLQGYGDAGAAASCLEHVLDAGHHALEAAEVDVRSFVERAENLVRILLNLREKRAACIS
jgi:hypothetical protein